MEPTDFRELLIGQGARWPEANAAPADFGNRHGEYSRGQSEAALFVQGDLAWFEVTGDDRAKYLHNFCTNDVKRLVPGQGCEAFVTSVQGKILAHVHLFCGQTAIRVVTTAAAADRLLMHWEKYHINEACEFHDRRSAWASLLAVGPDAAERLTTLGLAAPSLGVRNHFWFDTPPQQMHVARVDWLGQPGFLLTVERTQLSETWERLVAAGLAQAGQLAFDALRIEACYPQYGTDLTDANLAQEAHRDAQAISFSKGCYLGQEPIARIDALGHVNQELRGLRFQSPVMPPVGTALFSSTAADAKSVGKITSITLSPSDDLPVAIGLIRRGFLEPGQPLLARWNEETPAASEAAATGFTCENPAQVFWTGP